METDTFKQRTSDSSPPRQTLQRKQDSQVSLNVQTTKSSLKGKGKGAANEKAKEAMRLKSVAFKEFCESTFPEVEAAVNGLYKELAKSAGKGEKSKGKDQGGFTPSTFFESKFFEKLMREVTDALKKNVSLLIGDKISSPFDLYFLIVLFSCEADETQINL